MKLSRMLCDTGRERTRVHATDKYDGGPGDDGKIAGDGQGMAQSEGSRFPAAACLHSSLSNPSHAVEWNGTAGEHPRWR
jgi:hypothetical protein